MSTAKNSTETKVESSVRRFKPHPRCKDSGIDSIGTIPSHWQSICLKYVARFGYGDSLANEERIPGEYDVYGSNGVVGQHERPNTKGPCIVVGRKGSFGKVVYSERPCFAIDTTYYIDLTQTNNDLRWLYYCLQWLRLDAYSKDSAVPGLSREDAYKNPLPYCEYEEQRSIAAFLDRETARIDQLIARKERQIELLQEKRTALISHAVTKGLNPKAKMKDSGIEWLGEIPEHWKIVPLKFITANKAGAIKTGPFGSQLLSSEMIVGEIKVYNQRNVLDGDFISGENYITQDKYKQLQSFRVDQGDILLTTRGTIGRCAIVPNDAETGILHPCLMRIKPNHRTIVPEYLVLLIQDSDLVQTQLFLASNATTIDVIYSETMKMVRIPLPSLQEQHSIIEYLQRESKKIDNLRGKIGNSIERLKEYRTALISAAVTGKIDVRREAG